MEHLEKLETLVEIMDRLREPGGCPWDREQTYRSLRGYLLEEAYEALEALDQVEQDEGAALCEELGDVLLQIVFLSRLAKEQRRFTIDDVVRSITEKMIRRHPHVFGDQAAEDSEQVLEQWEEIKRREKAAKGLTARKSILDGLPAALPALVRAQRLGTKAARVGFDWAGPAEVLAKVDEEWGELREAIDAGQPAHTEEELGDVLFCTVMLARKLGIDPEAALQGANRKFGRRFRWIEQQLEAQGVAISDAGIDRLESLWGDAKRATADRGAPDSE